VENAIKDILAFSSLKNKDLEVMHFYIN